jgi:hypothetical protein
MIEKLIKNLGKHPSKEKTQHQILSLGRAIKLLPENERRDFKQGISNSSGDSQV